MNNIDYNQAGGFGLSTQILDAGQEAYKIFNAYGNMAGDLAVITGCEVGGGGYVTPGFVSIYGELLPFQGGQLSDNVAIVETSDLRGFEDGSQKPVIYTRYVAFGEATVSYPFASFRRPLTLFALEDRLLKVEKAVPIGLVAIWDRPAQEIPQGWVEHTDMRGNVPVGHNSGDTNFGSLGNTIGTTQVTIETSNLPPLNATVTLAPNPDTAGGNLYGRGGALGSVTFPVKTGSATPMTNIQPSRIVKFIRFVGIN